MIIKYGTGMGQLSGKVGGHYLQSSSRTPSLRTKRNKGQASVPRNNFSRRVHATISSFWSNSGLVDKASFDTFGKSAPYFAGLDSSNPLFPFWVFTAVNHLYAESAGSILFSVPGYAAVTPNTISIDAAEYGPLRIEMSKDVQPGGGVLVITGQLFFGASVAPEYRNLLNVIAVPQAATGPVILGNAFEEIYGVEVSPYSIQLTGLRFDPTVGMMEVCNTVQRDFIPAP